MAGDSEERSLVLTPTWSVASVFTLFVFVSLLLEHSINRLQHWLQRTNRRPLLQAVGKMKEELMLLGFISLLLTATSRTISNICIDVKFFDTAFSPCSRADEGEEDEVDTSRERKLISTFRRAMNELGKNKCFEQLHRFIFIMAVTHVSYSCLTMLLAIVKIHSWRVWEEQAHMDRNDSLTELTRDLVMRRQSTFVKFHSSNSSSRNGLVIWVTCFFRQFGHSVVRSDYLTLRKGFIMNHHLTSKYDFHSYMVRSMEEEFKRIVGSAGISGFFTGTKLKPRDDLFWFNKPEWVLSMIHFILFQNSFELASFFWYWWQFGYSSCYIKNHLLVYLRLIIGFAGQFLCSYSTLPLYALVTQMGTNYKAALIPKRIRETLHGWNKSVRKKRRMGFFDDSATIRTETCSVVSLEEDEQQTLGGRESGPHDLRSETELLMQDCCDDTNGSVEESKRVEKSSSWLSASFSARTDTELSATIARSASMPSERG
ncbi:hypothetical protein V2J09_007340 [Rumex salicifolius]